MSPRPIFLLTDFGAGSHYAGILHGVILARLPGARVVDLAHDIPPGGVRAAGHVLEAALPHLPGDAVCAVVVDPGVGGPRRILVAAAEGRVLVAPDNGVLTGLVLQGGLRLRALERQDLECRPRSATFHGRDVFAPAAAALADGETIDAMGPPLGDPVVLSGWSPVVAGRSVRGEVVHVDRFGNGITNLPADLLGPLGPGCVVELPGRTLDRFGRTFGDGTPGDPILYAGSSGHLAIGIRDGSAAATLGLGPGTPVTFRRR